MNEAHTSELGIAVPDVKNCLSKLGGDVSCLCNRLAGCANKPKIYSEMACPAGVRVVIGLYWQTYRLLAV